jgi:hypothetical protein
LYEISISKEGRDEEFEEGTNPFDRTVNMTCRDIVASVLAKSNLNRRAKLKTNIHEAAKEGDLENVAFFLYQDPHSSRRRIEMIIL